MNAGDAQVEDGDAFAGTRLKPLGVRCGLGEPKLGALLAWLPFDGVVRWREVAARLTLGLALAVGASAWAQVTARSQLSATGMPLRRGLGERLDLEPHHAAPLAAEFDADEVDRPAVAAEGLGVALVLALLQGAPCLGQLDDFEFE